jgi:DNA invertase Pin-like site-specific DNA recombinase
VAEFTEVESGKHADREELKKAIAACKKHKARLVIAKLDRLMPQPSLHRHADGKWR